MYSMFFITLIIFISIIFQIIVFRNVYLGSNMNVFYNNYSNVIGVIRNFYKNQLKRMVWLFKDFFLTVGLIIFLFNILGIIFYCKSISSYFVYSLSLSFTVWFSLSLLGEFFMYKYFRKLYIPHVPGSLFVLIYMIEAMSFTMRMFSLGVRLSANLIVGHVLLHFSSIFLIYFVYNGFFIGYCFIIFILYLFIFSLELMVCVVQTYIFTLLSLMYMRFIMNFII